MKQRFCIIVFLLYFFLAVPSLQKPVEGWEWLNRSAAEHIIKTGIPAIGELDHLENLLLIHPPSWCYLMGVSLKLFGYGDIQARLPGLIVMALTGLLLWLLAKMVLKSEAGAFIALGLYLTHPFAIQGALSSDFTDGTLLPLAITGFILCWFYTAQWPLVKRITLLGACFSVCLWAKLTTPLALIPCIILVGVGCYGAKTAIILSVGVALAGIGIFGATWLIYCKKLHLLLPGNFPFIDLFMTPFYYITGGGAALLPWELSLRDTAIQLTRIILWLGPLFLFVSTIGLSKRLQEIILNRKVDIEDIIWLLAIIVIMGYTFIQGGVGAFPKYYLTIVPLLAIYAARWITSEHQYLTKSTVFEILLILLISTGYFYLVVGDYIYIFNHDIRNALIFAGTRSAISHLILKLALYCVLPLSLWIFLKNSKSTLSFRSVICIFVFSGQIAISLLQGISPYMTKYYYGTPINDVHSVIRILKGIKEPRIIIAPKEFIYSAEAKAPIRSFSEVWDDPKKLKELVSKYWPQAIVYGLPTHTVHWIQKVSLDSQLLQILHKNYIKRQVGEFTIWLLIDDSQKIRVL